MTNLTVLTSVFAIGTAICSAFASAQELAYRADLAYSIANPDYSPYPNGEGLAWYGRVTLDQSVFVFTRGSNAQFKPSGMVSGAEIDRWLEAGLGYQHALSELWRLEGNVSYQEISQDNAKENGKGLQVGAHYQALEQLGLGLHLGKVDVQIDDWTLLFEADYQIAEHVYLVGRLRDYADWDFTYYEVGVGLNF